MNDSSDCNWALSARRREWASSKSWQGPVSVDQPKELSAWRTEELVDKGQGEILDQIFQNH